MSSKVIDKINKSVCLPYSIQCLCSLENHYHKSTTHLEPHMVILSWLWGYRAKLCVFNTHLFDFYLLEDLSVWSQRTEDLEGVYRSSAAKGWPYCPFNKCLWLEQRFFTLWKAHRHSGVILPGALQNKTKWNKNTVSISLSPVPIFQAPRVFQ